MGDVSGSGALGYPLVTDVVTAFWFSATTPSRWCPS